VTGDDPVKIEEEARNSGINFVLEKPVYVQVMAEIQELKKY
jgi:hypothetical protein